MQLEPVILADRWGGGAEREKERRKKRKERNGQKHRRKGVNYIEQWEEVRGGKR